MKTPGLAAHELVMVAGILRQHPEVTSAKLFGSRAKGSYRPGSDVDLAIWGNVDGIRAQTIAAELDELPLPYRFEVQPFGLIQLPALRDHIERVGIPVYPSLA